MFGSVFESGIVGKAIQKGLLEVVTHNLRDFTSGKHRQVDDRPFGGGQGMVFKPEPIFQAVEQIKKEINTPVYLLSPQGKSFDFAAAEKLAMYSRVILICGRYEGVDERVVSHLVTGEISIGDYILTGGEPAAWVIVDAVSRFIPGVVGKEESVKEDSFQKGIFSHPQYTRPRIFKGMEVPEVLFSGNHEKIDTWRREKALEKTRAVRSDLLEDTKNNEKGKKG